VRTDGDWEGWTSFFLDCVTESADDAVQAAGKVFQLLHGDRQSLARHSAATVSAIRLFELLPEHPMLTLAMVVDLLQTTKPTAAKAIAALTSAGILVERTRRRRDRVYGYRRYLALLSADTGLSPTV
jgi:Fic family protein